MLTCPSFAVYQAMRSPADLHHSFEITAKTACAGLHAFNILVLHLAGEHPHACVPWSHFSGGLHSYILGADGGFTMTCPGELASQDG